LVKKTAMRLISWNVNGVRAVAKKNFFEDFKIMAPDVLCLQETKAQDHQVQEALEPLLNDYHVYSCSAVKKGYSGVAIISKDKPLSIQYHIGIEEHDQEGRVITAEFANFYLVNVYVPNSGGELLRLHYRTQWDKAFFDFLKSLETKKPVFVCGDLNVVHRDIDLARPKPNYNKSAGYMQEEIDGLDRYVNGGFEDTFRALHPEKTGAYSWWSYRGGAREKNVGWRIDYFLGSSVMIPKVEKAFILSEVWGSDHCPVGIELKP
jgi:exodeoxyribonuclease-3